MVRLLPTIIVTLELYVYYVFDSTEHKYSLYVDATDTHTRVFKTCWALMGLPAIKEKKKQHQGLWESEFGPD